MGIPLLLQPKNNSTKTKYQSMKMSQKTVWLRKALPLITAVLLGTLGAFAQKELRVVGVVTDSIGDPVIGATVLAKGSSIGASTDIDGNYVINVPSNGTLVFSYVGFATQEIKVNGRTNIDVVMTETELNLDEVVVVGYGTARKISTIGAQSGVKFTAELKQPVATLSSVLAGRVAGVIGMQRSGEAGKDDNTQIWIRGVSTTTSATPLVLVDGVERSWTNIDPEDIESFQILKDASATAVYGVTGANGVILIQTKKGVKGKPKIKVELNYGITNFTRVPDLADGVTYMQMANEASINKTGVPVYSQDVIAATASGSDPMLYPNVNWMKTIFKDHGNNFRANINMNGGSDFAQYYFSLGYYNEGGLYRENKAEKYDGSMSFNRVNYVSNITMQPTKTTTVDFGVKGEISDYNTPYFSAADVFKTIMQAYPTLYPVTYDDFKTPYKNNGGGVKNPYAMIHRMGTNKRNTSETRADLNIRQNFDFWLQGLEARVLIAYDFYMRNDIQRIGSNPITYNATGRDPQTGELILDRTDNMNGKDTWDYNKQQWGHRQYYLEAALNYSNIFNNMHRVSAMLLYNMTDYSNVTAGTLYHAIPFRSMGLAGRGTYSFDDRYFFEANFGYNGAENFAPGKRFGFFPSFGAAWVPTNEKFSPPNEWLSFLKLRMSWGKAGNSILDNTARGESNVRFVYLPTVASGNGYTFGDQRQNGYGGVAVGRPAVDVTWETSTKYNLGLDLHMFNSSLQFQFDLFKERRDNIFLQRAAVPSFVGITTMPYSNLGIVENKGFEITGDYSKQVQEVGIMFRANFSFNKNKIIEDDTADRPYEWLNSRGHSLNTYFGYVCDGFYSEDDIANPDVPKLKGGAMQPGDLKYRDLNGDNVIDAYDKCYIGNPTVPQIVYGFGATFTWRNFYLGAFFQGVGKSDISLSASNFKPFSDGSAKGNLYANIVNRWSPANPSPDAEWPRLDYGMSSNTENYQMSTFWLRDGSYLRMKTLDFGYNIPDAFVKKLRLNSFRVYFQAYNLFTISKFKMWDVELGAGDGTAYPNTRSFNIGVNFSF